LKTTKSEILTSEDFLYLIVFNVLFVSKSNNFVSILFLSLSISSIFVLGYCSFGFMANASLYPFLASSYF